jgi:DNA-binding LytR/AlgR family response regulator
MRCIIIEDQPPAQRILKKFIDDYGALELVGTFPDALQAMRFLGEQSVDLIFLDIHLPKMSGIDFLKSLPHPPQIILTTAFPDYALEGYELNVVDYLLKPFSFQRFVKAVAKAQPSGTAPSTPAATTPPPAIFVKSGYEYLKVELADIRYLHADTDYTEIILADKKILSSDPLKYWEEELPADQFVRVHKSYIVQLSWIEKVVGNQIYLPGPQIIPIGRAYKEAFFQKLEL